VLLRVVDGRYAGKRLSEIFPSRTPGPTVRTNSYVIQEEDEDVSAERKLVSAQDLVSRKSFGPDQVSVDSLAGLPAQTTNLLIIVLIVSY